MLNRIETVGEEETEFESLGSTRENLTTLRHWLVDLGDGVRTARETRLPEYSLADFWVGDLGRDEVQHPQHPYRLLSFCHVFIRHRHRSLAFSRV